VAVEATAPEEFDDDEELGEERPAGAVAQPEPEPELEREPERAEPPEAAPTPARTRPVADGDTGDIEGARLIALNMALNGQSRDETDRYLAENFDLTDRESLLDEVYESVGG
jgi:hypothetical protein